MSIETILDKITYSLLSSLQSTLQYISSNTPKVLFPYALSAYVFLLDITTRVKKQSYLTLKAVVQSFQSESIYFYKYGTAYAPVLSTTSNIQGSSAWMYSIDTSTFYDLSSYDTHSNNHLPILGASLCYLLEDSSTAIPIGDLSEWIQDQRFSSTLPSVPYQVLVSAWSYCTIKTMYYNYTNYVLVVTDLEGNETAYNLDTGDTIPVPTIDSGIDTEELNTQTPDTQDSSKKEDSPTTEEVTL